MLPVTLATELTHKTLWYPTILGVLVVVAGFALFCGSVYLLLGTNLGARLGFLVAFTGFAGFMVVLSALWVTTSSPLNTLKGSIPKWEVLEVVEELDQAETAQARSIRDDGHRVDTTEAANVKAAVDEALVTKESTAAHPVEPEENRFAQFPEVTDYLTQNTFEVGGSNPRFYKLQFTHVPLFAVVEFCEVEPPPADRAFGLPPLPPECASDPAAKTGFVVLERDLGSLRLPPTLVFFGSLILFALGLLSLHWREKDELERARAAAEAKAPAPVAVPVPEPVEV